MKCSIIIPAYNVSKYIVDCLDSVFVQDVDSETFEVVVVDDCSPDNEKEIVEAYMALYPNIRYIRHDVNKCLGGARNTGIRAAQGEYVMFLDADDILIYKNTLSIFFRFIDESNPLVLCSDSFLSISSDSRFEQLVESLENGEYSVERVKHTSYNFLEWRLSNKFCCNAWGVLYKRDFLIKYDLFFREHVFYEDADWKHKTLYYANNIDVLDFVCYGYRQSPGSITRVHSIAAFEGNVASVLETYRFYLSINDNSNELLNILREEFVNNAIDLLLFSRNYPVWESCRILEELNRGGLTTLYSRKIWKNVILYLIRYMPCLPVLTIKIIIKLKRMFRI